MQKFLIIHPYSLLTSYFYKVFKSLTHASRFFGCKYLDCMHFKCRLRWLVKYHQ